MAPDTHIAVAPNLRANRREGSGNVLPEPSTAISGSVGHLPILVAFEVIQLVEDGSKYPELHDHPGLAERLGPYHLVW